MSLAVEKDNNNFTYKDYCSWPEDERWELIEGIAYNMSPGPSREHQEISGDLFNQLYNFFKDKQCSVYAAPFDVRLPENSKSDDQINTIVQPDISVICDKNKLDDKGCKGAPDFIIEIISPSTATKDLREKLLLYEKYRVQEYWIIYPSEKIVMVYKLGKNKKYGRNEVFSYEDTIKLNQFGALQINLGSVFKRN